MINNHEITPERHKSIYLINYSIGFNGKNQKENIFRFRLTGVPPSQAIKRIQINPDHSITEIKKTIQREYKLNPILVIQFIFQYYQKIKDSAKSEFTQRRILLQLYHQC